MRDAGSLRRVTVRALVFDVFGTLVDWRSAIARAFREAEVLGDSEELADAWRAGVWPILGEVNEGKRPWITFDEVHRVALDELLSKRGLDLPADARAELVGAWHRLDPWTDVRDGLERLRRPRVVAALSNGNVSLLIDLARHGDLRFDCLLSAEMAGVYKPAAEVYLAAPRMLGLAPEEVMLVAAHPFDLKGARRAGLRTAFVERPLEYGPGSPAREDPEADESVGDLLELAPRLEG
jgi:2-haloacid dehalogenase